MTKSKKKSTTRTFDLPQSNSVIDEDEIDEPVEPYREKYIYRDGDTLVVEPFFYEDYALFDQTKLDFIVETMKASFIESEANYYATMKSTSDAERPRILKDFLPAHRNEMPTAQPSTLTTNGQEPTISEEPDLIETMNILQRKFVANGCKMDVSLPQIAVVGGQSAGKSSVLENIVGREFLPRGSGVVTKRPILIQLFPISSGEDYAIFGHKDTEKFTDFNKVKKEIQEQMPSKTDGGQNVFSSVPIALQIYSTKVLQLTLIDLPGVVRNVFDGECESNISEVKEMVLNYISKPECLILAVTPANQDLVLSDALEIAKAVDPERSRTIGVLTKLDLMDEGTNACAILENRQIQLQRGYIAVLNRSQKDTDEGKDVQYILAKEKRFFKNTPCYRHLADKVGTPNLCKTLQKMLRVHIKAALPAKRGELAEKLSGLNKQLKKLRTKMGEGADGKQQYMLKLVNTFIEDITIKLMGNSERVDMKAISAGAHIYYKLNTEVMNNLKLSLVPNDEDMAILITNLHGIRGAPSFHALALDAMCRKLLEEFEYPLEKSVECVMNVLGDAVVSSASMMDEYPTMKNEILFRIKACTEIEAMKTQEKLREHIQAEMFYVNLEHPDLDLSSCDDLVPSVGPSIWANSNTGTPSTSNGNDKTAIDSRDMVKLLMQNESTQKRVQYVMQVVTKYLEIVQKRIEDVAKRYTVTFLVKKVLDFIKIDLVADLLSSANLASLEEDCEEDFRRKEQIEISRCILKDALDAIQKF